MKETTAASQPVGSTEMDVIDTAHRDDHDGDMELQKPAPIVAAGEAGTHKMEAIAAVSGKNGKVFLLTALVISMMAYELDNTTVYTYYTFALSSYSRTATTAALVTAYGIIFATAKPLVAKLSDVVGRAELYPVWALFHIIGHALCAASPNYESWAAGYIFHVLAQTGINTLNNIMAADISSARQRGFAVQVQFLPFLFMPFTSALMTAEVINGIGWRWGIGMLAIIMPVGLAPLFLLLMKYQRKAKRAGLGAKVQTSIRDFFAQVDAGGMLMFCGGLAMILVPIAMVGTLPGSWSTPWVIALLVVGILALAALPFYESRLAKFPIVPLHYFKDINITMSLLLATTDGIANAVTGAYMYTWLIVAREYSVRDANFINTAEPVMQLFSGLVVGGVLWWSRKYKWTLFVGVLVRLLGYGLMFRIRNGTSSMGEIIAVQLIQGLGNGIVGTGSFVAATVAVPHREVAQMTAVVICLSTLGGTVGSAIAGGIYTNAFKPELSTHLGSLATPELVESVFNSITLGLPKPGTLERMAISAAYNTIMAYCTYTAFASAVPGLAFAWFLPDKTLTDAQNIVE